MTPKEQHAKLQQASKMLYDASKLIREARAGGDNRARPFFGAMQVAHDRCHEGRELLAEACHTIRGANSDTDFVPK